MIDNDMAGVSAFVDTSVIVRYLVRDSPDQAELARRIIEEHPRLLVTGVVIAEAALVLTSFYSRPREAVIDALVELIQRKNIGVHEVGKDIAIQALLLCRPSGRVSFADAMLWASARSSGTGGTVYTLDRRFPAIGIVVRTELSS